MLSGRIAAPRACSDVDQVSVHLEAIAGVGLTLPKLRLESGSPGTGCVTRTDACKFAIMQLESLGAFNCAQPHLFKKSFLLVVRLQGQQKFRKSPIEGKR